MLMPSPPCSEGHTGLPKVVLDVPKVVLGIPKVVLGIPKVVLGIPLVNREKNDKKLNERRTCKGVVRPPLRADAQ